MGEERIVKINTTSVPTLPLGPCAGDFFFLISGRAFTSLTIPAAFKRAATHLLLQEISPSVFLEHPEVEMWVAG